MKKEKDKSFHFWLTETRHTSLKELSDQFDRIERMLKWLILYSRHRHPGEFLRAIRNAKGEGREFPDISDILEEK